MSKDYKPIESKPKGDADTATTVSCIIEILEDLEWRASGDMGVFECLITQCRKDLTGALEFYTRHRDPRDKIRDQARKTLKSAYRSVVSRLFENLNKVLPKKQRLPLPCSLSLLEATCDQLFVPDPVSKHTAV